MLHNGVILHAMARGDSGRIVLEIDPLRKGELYAAVNKEGLTLKEWFLRQTAHYLDNLTQPSLFTGLVREPLPPYETNDRPDSKSDIGEELV